MTSTISINLFCFYHPLLSLILIKTGKSLACTCACYSSLPPLFFSFLVLMQIVFSRRSKVCPFYLPLYPLLPTSDPPFLLSSLHLSCPQQTGQSKKRQERERELWANIGSSLSKQQTSVFNPCHSNVNQGCSFVCRTFRAIPTHYLPGGKLGFSRNASLKY